MEKKQQRIQDLNSLIQIEKEIYAKAIKNNRGFEDVKLLYLKIKKLEQEADEMMQQTLPEENITHSAADEMRFLKMKEDLVHKTKEYLAAIQDLSLDELLNPITFSKVTSLRYYSI